MKSKIVLIGGGHAHALLLAKIKKQPIENTEIYLIDTNEKAPYTGMLPGFTAGHYSRDDLYIDLAKAADGADVNFIQATVTGVDHKTKKVSLNNGEILDYDLVSFDIGIHARDYDIPGLAEQAVPVKPLGEFSIVWQKFMATNKQNPNLVIIGGGVGAVEMAFAMQHACQEQSPKVTLITRGQMLSQLPSKTAQYLQREIKKKNISIEANQTIQSVNVTEVILENGKKIPSDFTLSAVGARPYKWIEDTKLELNNGYIRVNNKLQSVTDPHVFAVGDCAHFDDYPLPKAGVYAVREAPILYKNLKAVLEKRILSVFKPQKDYLKLITLGEKRACGDKFGICVSGSWVWYLKNKIDRDFMCVFN